MLKFLLTQKSFATHCNMIVFLEQIRELLELHASKPGNERHVLPMRSAMGSHVSMHA